MEHHLTGIKLIIGSEKHGLAMILNTTTDKRKVLLCNCNGALSEVDITDIEDLFVKNIYACNVDKLEEYYWTGISIAGIVYKLSVSFDDIYIKSKGEYFPDELYKFLMYLRSIGVPMPLKKYNGDKCIDQD